MSHCCQASPIPRRLTAYGAPLFLSFGVPFPLSLVPLASRPGRPLRACVRHQDHSGMERMHARAKVGVNCALEG
jgi:hypothetical protein